MLELEDVMQLLEPLVEMAPASHVPTERGWEIWHAALEDLPAAAVRDAVVAYLTSEATDNWMPPPATIRRLACEIAHGRALSADEAWGLVLQAAATWSRHDKDARAKAHAMLPADVSQLFHDLCGSFSDFRGKTNAAQQNDRRAFLQAWQTRADRLTKDRMRPAGLQAPIAAGGLPAPTPRPEIDGAISNAADRMRIGTN